MEKMKIETVYRSEACVEFYREDWGSHNIKIAQTSWNGPIPFSTAFWPRYYSEVKRHGIGWFRFQNAADMTLEILLEGSLEYTQNGITETVKPGDIYIMHEGSDSIFNAYPDSYFHRLRLTLFGNLVCSITQELHLTGHRLIRPENPDFYISEFRRIGSLLSRRDPNDAQEISSSAFRLLSELAVTVRGRTKVPELLERILSDMKSELDRNFSIQEFAARRKMEVHTLMRLFRKHLNTSPREYLISLRMEEAKHLVGSSTLSMKEIASRLGYTNPLYFSSAFRKHFRVSPSSYRESRKSRNRD